MCAQYQIFSRLRELASYFRAKVLEDVFLKSHLFPKMMAPVVRLRQGERVVEPMQFGLIPFFEKNEKPKKVFHNARSETILEKPSFQKAYRESRCLVPMNAFFEYVPGEGGRKKLLRFFSPTSELIVAAGIHSLWRAPSGEQVESFSILTREPPEIVKNAGHDRCPLFLEEKNFSVWLGENENTLPHYSELLLLPTPVELSFDTPVLPEPRSSSSSPQISLFS